MGFVEEIVTCFDWKFADYDFARVVVKIVTGGHLELADYEFVRLVGGIVTGYQLSRQTIPYNLLMKS